MSTESLNFFDAVRARRSVRIFGHEAVPTGVIDKALDAALLAPNSSNMQPWEFYWVRTPEKKKALAKACLSQPAATTAQELVVAVCRSDTWRRNCRLMLETFAKEDNPNAPKARQDYYEKVVPLAYTQGWFSVFGALKWLIVSVVGLFRPVPRSPVSRSELFQVLHKTTALACENFMLAIAAQGFASCPMEGFDEKRVKRLLGLGRHAQVVMILGVGKADPRGIWGERIRFARELFVHHV